jgi:hypothetical protein
MTGLGRISSRFQAGVGIYYNNRDSGILKNLQSDREDHKIAGN